MNCSPFLQSVCVPEILLVTGSVSSVAVGVSVKGVGEHTQIAEFPMYLRRIAASPCSWMNVSMRQALTGLKGLVETRCR